MRTISLFAIIFAAFCSAVLGQATNISITGDNIHITWAAVPNAPYRVVFTPNLCTPVFSNLTPAEVIFSTTQGAFDHICTTQHGYFFVMGSEYIVVDISGGPSADSFPLSFLSNSPSGGWPSEYKTTKLVVRRIPAGLFTMGCPTNEVGHEKAGMDESQHAVRITKDFYIGVFEITQKQWELVMGTNPSFFTNANFKETRPVESVNLDNVRGDNLIYDWPASTNVAVGSFAGRLQAKTGLRFDLPTEAQWEYACRAGTHSAVNSGNNLSDWEIDASFYNISRYYSTNINWLYTRDEGLDAGPLPVGYLAPNGWGLYDLHGNVSEMCLDYCADYPTNFSVDPLGPTNGSTRVLRGGDWPMYAGFCRSASRYWYSISSSSPGFESIGLRIAISQ